MTSPAPAPARPSPGSRRRPARSTTRPRASPPCWRSRPLPRPRSRARTPSCSPPPRAPGPGNQSSRSAASGDLKTIAFSAGPPAARRLQRLGCTVGDLCHGFVLRAHSRRGAEARSISSSGADGSRPDIGAPCFERAAAAASRANDGGSSQAFLQRFGSLEEADDLFVSIEGRSSRRGDRRFGGHPVSARRRRARCRYCQSPPPDARVHMSATRKIPTSRRY